MLQLSVIIVNYNVRFFLEQALLSVKKAVRHLSAEIIVVDNNSVDGTGDMMREKFPDVIYLENKENIGFAKANNQGIGIAKGKYVLLLNPDTIVEEDTFEKCIQFMEAHPDAGALGVKMLDGKGNFLPESKRGFPTPSVGFYKAFGLSRLFPKSKTFGSYHLGYLSENETHEVDVLAGAFMFIRKTALDKAGWLDEAFFMYGEDIDLSYRIVKAGYKNYYFADTRIIHYKGESTRKGTMNYVRMFYQAMIIFAQKHFSSSGAGIYILMLKAAIYLRALLSVIYSVMHRWSLPVVDALTMYGGMLLLKNYWQYNVKVAEGLTYPEEYIYFIIPGYILIWLLSVFFSGGYEKNARPARIIRGLFFGTVVIAAIYGFLPDTMRFSRAMIILGFIFGLFSMIGIRLLLHFARYKNLRLDETMEKKLVIVGNREESSRVEMLLNQAKVKNDYIGYVSTRKETQYSAHHLGEVDQLSEIARIYKIDEVIFCSKDISAQRIIEWMSRLGTDLEYKIVPEDSLSIIGSNSKDAPGELYTIEIKLAIATSFNKRSKRLFDLAAALFLLLTLPVNILIVSNPAGLAANIFRVFAGRKSWVGYAGGIEQQYQLPPLREAVLTPLDELKNLQLNDAAISRINLLYAKDYSTSHDAELFIKCYRSLGSVSAPAAAQDTSH
ncbi:MAG: glycosyltransferase [Chitinophagales bacterium]|nr:glycosyltransferase [Chitinophagales bacterium]